MILELNHEERNLLVSLVDARIRELHPEIRRTMDFNYRDELKEELQSYKNLLARLQPTDVASPVFNET